MSMSLFSRNCPCSLALQVRSHSREKQLLAWSCPSVDPSVRMHQRGSYSKDFREIFILPTFMKICRKASNLVQVGQKYQAL